jgi:replicative DNA helicase
MDEYIKTNKKGAVSANSAAQKKIGKSGSVSDLLQHSKLPPQATEIEEAVLGAMMLETNALTAVIDILKPDTFYKDAHQKIFTAMLDLFGKSEPIDILTVTNELKKNGNLDVIGGPFYISQLVNRVASSANIEYHARIIMQKYIQRELIRISSEITKDAYEDTTDVLELLDNAEKNLFSIGEDNIRRKWEDMRTLVKEAINSIEFASKMEGHLTGVGTGYTKLDHITGGWQKSYLVIIASRPSMGKTAFTLTMARNMAVELKKPVAFFSLEMSALQLVTRLIASESRIDSNKIKNGTLDPEEWNQLHRNISQLTEAPLYIDDTPALSIFELRAKCRRLKQQHNIAAAVIDYLQLMSTGKESRGNREQEISGISRALKSLAKELDIPIIVLSQLSRAVETRTGNKKPILSDLRESGAIEQDADVVLFIYRPEYYKLYEDEEGNPTQGLAEIIVAKHRNGAIGNVKLRFISNFAKFEDISEFGSDEDSFSGISENRDFDSGPRTYTIPSKMNDMSDEPPE